MSFVYARNIQLVNEINIIIYLRHRACQTNRWSCLSNIDF